MKKVLFLVFWGLFCHIASFAHDGIRQLVQFYESADMDGYYSMAQRNINEDLSQLYRNGGCVELKIPIPFVEITNEQGSGKLLHHTYKYKGQIHNENNFNEQIGTEKLVPMLSIQFINTGNYKSGDNLYDYIRIDSVIVFSMVGLDKRNRIQSFWHFDDGDRGYEPVERFSIFHRQPDCHYSRYSKKLPSAYRRIRKENPTLLLSNYHIRNKGGMLYVKGDSIYVYDIATGKRMELNSYVKTNFSTEQIQAFDNISVPNIYEDKWGNDRKAGYTPQELINIYCCPIKTRTR